MAGPLAVVIAGTITMWISFAGADALVVDDYYKQGKAINQDLRRERVAASLNLALALRYDAAAGKLQGQLTGEQPARELTLMLVHPTMPSKDMKRTLVTNPDGSFSLPLPLLERAHWQVELEDAARQWRLHGDWHWPQQKMTDIQAVPRTDQDANKGGG
jgi:hypothetical protein